MKKIFHIILFFFLLISPCLATTYFVDATPGEDCSGNYNPETRDCDGSGSYDSWDTVQEAADNVSSGIVEIRSGTYTENVYFDTNSGSGSTPQVDASYIVFRGYQSEWPVITWTSWFTIYFLEDWIKVEHIIFRNSYSSGHIFAIGGDTDPDTDGSSNNWIYNCEVDGNNQAQYGIQIISQYCTGSGCYFDDNIVESNTVHDLGAEGIYFNKYTGFSGSIDGNQMLNNTVYNCDEGLQITHENGGTNVPPSNSVIRGNIIYNNGGSWGALDVMGENLIIEDNFIHDNTDDASGIYIGWFSGTVQVRNNVIWDGNGYNNWSEYDAGIWLNDDGTESGTVNVYHNTIYNQQSQGSQDGRGILIQSGLSSMTVNVKNNIIHSSEGIAIDDWSSAANIDYNDCYNNGSLGDCSGGNNRTGNPNFADVSEGTEDFSISPTSDAIDYGTDVGISDDILGNARDASPDIGAYEYQAEGRRIIITNLVMNDE